MTIRDTDTQQLILETNLVEHFRSSVDDALSNQNIEVEQETAHYLVNILSYFSRSENLFQRDTEGCYLQPLALIYAEAFEAPLPQVRMQLLRRLGDISLFICGVFSSSLNRKVVDMDYYAAMGGGAYAYLSDDRHEPQASTLCEIFSELAVKFTDCIDVLAEASERECLDSNRDVMRTYEVWLRTGSRRALRALQKIGIHPIAASTRRGEH